MIVSLKRVFRTGWSNFTRGRGLSLITIFVMFLTVSLVSSLFLFRGLADFLLVSLEKKIDIAVYFKESATEEDIFKIKDSLAEIQGVKGVDYVSEGQALSQFQAKHQGDDSINQALNELGDNPFLASLNVSASDVLQYDEVSQFLQSTRFESLIDRVDYGQRKPIIERFYSLRSAFESGGLAVALILGFIAFSITFVTIRLAIYSAGEEIGIMRLVGASNWFIRGPFLVQGLICGLLAFLVSFLVLLGTSYFLSPKIFDLTSGFELFKYLLSNWPALIGLQLISGVGLGTVSSLVAISRYLEK